LEILLAVGYFDWPRCALVMWIVGVDVVLADNLNSLRVLAEYFRFFVGRWVQAVHNWFGPGYGEDFYDCDARSQGSGDGSDDTDVSVLP
jgi:hypothetical protein